MARGPGDRGDVGRGVARLDFDVDREVIRALSPGPVWRRLARLADRLSPVENWNGGDSLLRDVCRSTRGDEWASITTLARRAASFAKARRRWVRTKSTATPRARRRCSIPAATMPIAAAYFTAVEESSLDT